MSDEKIGLMSKKRMEEIARLAMASDYGADARAHVGELLAALEAAQAPDAIVKLSAQRDIALDALVKAEKERDAARALANETAHQLGKVGAERLKAEVERDVALKERDEARRREEQASKRAQKMVKRAREWRDVWIHCAEQLGIQTGPETSGSDLTEAIVERVRKAEKAREVAVWRSDRAHDCGQDDVCAMPPGCGRHWAQRNRELVTERDALAARVAELERDLADSKELTTEHYVRAESAYSRGLEAGAADAAARVAELEVALAAARVNELEEAQRIVEADLLDQPGVIVAAERRFDGGSSERAVRRIAAKLFTRRSRLMLTAAPPEQAPASPAVEDSVTFAAVLEAKNRAILAALERLPTLIRGEEFGDEVVDALDFVRARLEEALPLNEEQALYRVAPRTDDGALRERMIRLDTSLQAGAELATAFADDAKTGLPDIAGWSRMLTAWSVGAKELLDGAVASTTPPPLALTRLLRLDSRDRLIWPCGCEAIPIRDSGGEILGFTTPDTHGAKCREIEREKAAARGASSGEAAGTDDATPPALPWPVTANAMHAGSVDFPDVESDAFDNVCGVFTVAECLTGDLAKVTCLDCLRSIARQRGDVAARLRRIRAWAKLNPGELLRRFEALDDEIPMTDEEAKAILAEAGITEEDQRGGLARALEAVRAERPADVGAAPTASTGTAAAADRCPACSGSGLEVTGDLKREGWSAERQCGYCGGSGRASTGTARAPEKRCRCGLVVGCSAPELHAEGCEELERLRTEHARRSSTGAAPAPVTLYCSPRVAERAAAPADDRTENGPDGKPFYVHGSECEGACDYGCSGSFVDPGPTDATPAADPLCALEGCGHPLSVHQVNPRSEMPLGCWRALMAADGTETVCPCPGFVAPGGGESEGTP